MRILMVFVLVVVLGEVRGQQKLLEVETDSRITGVKVFMGQAQVTRSGRTRIGGGKTDVILRGLTAELDPTSIQVSGKGNFTILGISHRQNFYDERTGLKGIAVIEDSIRVLAQYEWLEKNEKAILEKEEKLLLASGTDDGKQRMTVAELKAMADFLRARLHENALLRVKQDDKIRVVSERLARLHRQLGEMRELRSRHTSEIVVHVSADAAGMADLEAQYIVNGASWTPLYDLRARDTKSPVELLYKANVQQATGEDWNDVQLTLSTANPSLGGMKPELSPWYLNFYRPEVVGVSSGYYDIQSINDTADKRKAKRPLNALQGRVAGVEIEEAAPVAEVLTVQTVQTALHAEFVIGIPYSVASATKPTLVDIHQHSLPSDYLYLVTPKLDADAFLMARVTGWEAFNLLPGEASVFFEGTFVGRTQINPSVVDDTLALSLGRDKRIVVKRETVTDKTATAVVGSRRKNSYSYAITVRNAKADEIRIVVEDQVPVSRDNQIEVSLVNAGGGRNDDATGKIVWEATVKAGETKKIGWGYEVRFPKGKKISARAEGESGGVW